MYMISIIYCVRICVVKLIFIHLYIFTAYTYKVKPDKNKGIGNINFMNYDRCVMC